MLEPKFHGGTMIRSFLGVLAISATAMGATQNIEAVPGEYVVKLKNSAGVQAHSINTLSKSLGMQVKDVLTSSGQYILVKSASRAAVSANPNVEYAEPNLIYHLVGSPNDVQYGQLWGMNNTGQPIKDSKGVEIPGVAGIDIGAEKAWEITTGSKDVIVAVIDTGVGRNIEDIKDNMWVNEAELKGKAGTDDDKNGFVDDIYGMDFANNDSDPMDDHGHGSHVSGTIGARGDNALDVAGVTWNVRIMALKFLSASGSGSLEGAIKAIDYATNKGANVMSNSWGGGGFSQALMDAITRAKDKGILFVAAAGNAGQNNDNTPTYPASYKVDNILTVAAVDNKGSLASFSCFGVNSVHVGAPGVNVISTTPSGLQVWNGTSMATPHVSGVAALLKAKFPEMKAADLKERIISTAKPLPALRGKVSSAGMVNAYLALTNQQAPPDPNDPNKWATKAYTLSSPHPYGNKADMKFDVKVEGAKRFALHFSNFETEVGYDFVKIYSSTGTLVQTLSGKHSNEFSVVIDGDSAVIQLTSDTDIDAHGFDIDKVAVKME